MRSSATLPNTAPAAGVGERTAVGGMLGARGSGAYGSEGTRGNESVGLRAVLGNSGTAPGADGSLNGVNNACVPVGIGTNGVPFAGGAGNDANAPETFTPGWLPVSPIQPLEAAALPVGPSGFGGTSADLIRSGKRVCVGSARGCGTSSVPLAARGRASPLVAEDPGVGIGVAMRGSGLGPEGGDGSRPEAALSDAGALTHGARMGDDGRGGAPGALGRGVGTAAPFFQVSEFAHPRQRNSDCAGTATTSAGSGSSHNGHTGASINTSACSIPAAPSNVTSCVQMLSHT